MRTRAPLIGLLAASSLLACACGGPADADARELTGDMPFTQVPLDAVPSVSEFVQHSALLGLRALGTGEGNPVVSPASLTTALAILAPAAGGTALASLEGALGASAEDAAAAVNALQGVLDAYAGELAQFDPATPPAVPFWHGAQQLLLDSGAEPTDQYLDVLSSSFDLPVTTADMAGSQPILDEWVAENTAGLIPASGVQPDDQTVFVLQDALLFGASWANQFPDYKTMDQPFSPLEGAAFDVSMMSDRQDLPYAEVGGWSAVALDFTEGFRAIVALPPEGSDPLADGPEQVAATLESLSLALASSGLQDVDVTMPLLELGGSLDLIPALQQAGLGALFDCGGAPLPGLGEQVCIGQMVQQTTLDVSEKGAVAAAVTEIQGAGAAPGVPEEPIYFVADRPYLFVIEETQTGWDLMQAAVRDPR